MLEFKVHDVDILVLSILGFMVPSMIMIEFHVFFANLGFDFVVAADQGGFSWHCARIRLPLPHYLMRPDLGLRAVVQVEGEADWAGEAGAEVVNARELAERGRGEVGLEGVY